MRLRHSAGQKDVDVAMLDVCKTARGRDLGIRGDGGFSVSTRGWLRENYRGVLVRETPSERTNTI
jgi:hypothetical protein